MTLVWCVAAGPGAAWAQGETVLRWRLEKGAAFWIETRSESRVRTIRTAADEARKGRPEREGCTLLARVLEVKPDGTAVVELSIHERKWEQWISSAETGWEEGKKKVRTFPRDESASGRIVEKFLGNLLDLRCRMEVTPRGRVLSSRTEGDPFKDLPQETDEAGKAVAGIRELFRPRDFFSPVGGELFVELPEKGIRFGSTWSFSRSGSLLGLGVSGSTSALVWGLERNSPFLEATIRESTLFRIEGSGLERRLDAAMKAMDLPGEGGLTLSLEDPVQEEVETVFDVDQGFVVARRAPRQKVAVRSRITGTREGRPFEDRFRIEIESSWSTTWTRARRGE